MTGHADADDGKWWRGGVMKRGCTEDQYEREGLQYECASLCYKCEGQCYKLRHQHQICI